MEKKHREKIRNTGKTQGKYREFYLGWNVATLLTSFLTVLLAPLSLCRLDICSQLLGMYQKSHPSSDFTSEAEQYDSDQRLRVSRFIRFWNTAILPVVPFFGLLSNVLKIYRRLIFS